MSKERIFVRRLDVDLDDIFSFKDLGGMLEGAKKVYAKFSEIAKKEKLMVEFTTDWAGYDGGTEVYANFYRWETDKEYQARIDEFNAKEEAKRLRKEVKKAKALAKILADEQEERKLLAKLQAKYGTDTKFSESDFNPGRDLESGPKLFKDN